jgi:hypothetical protein
VLLLALQFLAARYLGAAEYGWANYLLGFAATISTFTYFGYSFTCPKNCSVQATITGRFPHFLDQQLYFPDGFAVDLYPPALFRFRL